MDRELVQALLDHVQYALDSHETARLNNYTSRIANVFFETTIGELRAAKIRLTRELNKEVA